MELDLYGCVGFSHTKKEEKALLGEGTSQSTLQKRGDGVTRSKAKNSMLYHRRACSRAPSEMPFPSSSWPLFPPRQGQPVVIQRACPAGKKAEGQRVGRTGNQLVIVPTRPTSPVVSSSVHLCGFDP